MENWNLAMGLMIGAVVLLAVYFLILLITNHSLDKDKRNSLLNSYPYQFYQNLSIPLRSLLYFLLFAYLICAVLGGLFFLVGSNTSYQSIIGGMLAFSMIMLVSGNVVPLTKYKIHILLNMLGFGFISLSLLCFCFVSLIPAGIFYPDSVSLGSQIIAGILGFLMFASLFNPKLLDWSKMEKSEVDGVSYYEKPKVNCLPLYEWVYLISTAVVLLCFIINIIIA
ncbi:MAG: hypothetical protein WCR67_04405 [Bacilli bacterium]